MISPIYIISCVSLAATVLGADLLPRAASSSLVCNSDNLLRALQHRTPDSYSFCSSYISQQYYTTATVVSTSTETYTPHEVWTAHPQYLYNLQRFSSSWKPITYTNKAVPTPLPVNARDYYQGYSAPPSRRNAQPSTLDLVARATTTPAVTTTTSSVPAYLASYPPSRISSGCTCLSPPYAETWTTTVLASSVVEVITTPCTDVYTSAKTTVPSICNVRGQDNAPAVQTGVANVATVPKFSSPSKLDCCNACVNVFNCLWWKFDFAHPAADGTGDGWSPGMCQYAFYNGIMTQGYPNDTPAVCPNALLNLLQGETRYRKSLHDTWNVPGYNKGPCAPPPGVFQSSEDPDDPQTDGDGADNICPS